MVSRPSAFGFVKLETMLARPLSGLRITDASYTLAAAPKSVHVPGSSDP
jgi:hypothetical protein